MTDAVISLSDIVVIEGVKLPLNLKETISQLIMRNIKLNNKEIIMVKFVEVFEKPKTEEAKK